jgi:hypothetical protein
MTTSMRATKAGFGERGVFGSGEVRARRALDAAISENASPMDKFPSLTSTQATAAIVDKAHTFLLHRRGYSACMVYLCFLVSVTCYIAVYLSSDSSFELDESVNRALFPDDLIGVENAWLLPTVRLREHGFASKWLHHVLLDSTDAIFKSPVCGDARCDAPLEVPS